MTEKNKEVENTEEKEETLEELMQEEAVDGQEEAATEEPETQEEEQTAEEGVEEEPELSEEELEKQKKQEAYRERQRKKAQEKKQQLEAYDERVQESVNNIEEDEQKAAIEFVKSFRQQQEFVIKLNKAEKELQNLENDFKEAFTDYDDVVNDALEFSRLRLVDQGMTESQADEALRREKILIADRAAAQGEDPVEAVYNEAKSIMSLIERYVEKKGLKKDERPKTNLQAIREINKPNAMTGGKGRGATVRSTSFDDLEKLEDIDAVPLGELMG